MAGEIGRAPQVVIIGDSEAPLETCKVAEQIGERLGRSGVTVVTGGRTGVMEAASRGARRAGGTAVGILPSNMLAEANRWCSVVIGTGLGDARNVLTVLSGDAVIAIGGGAGTLSEICFAWIHGKPIFTLKGVGGWSEKVGQIALDHRREDVIRQFHSLDELVDAVLDTIGKGKMQSGEVVRPQ